MLNIYSASAGAGKTYNLVINFLTVCFEDYVPRFQKDPENFECPRCSKFKEILAITFTNNAAAEMKQRIVEKLNQFAFAKSYDDCKSDFDNLYKKCFKSSTPPQDPEKYFKFFNVCSQTLLHDIIYDYGRFSISTIDKFVQNLIRSSALYLGLNMNYAVQIQIDDFCRSVVNQYISSLTLSNPQMKTIVDELSMQLGDAGKTNIYGFLENCLDIVYGHSEKSHLPISENKKIPQKDFQNRISEWKNEYYKAKNKYYDKNDPGALPTVMSAFADEAAKIFEAAKQDGLKVNGNSKWHEKFERMRDDVEYWKSLGGESSGSKFADPDFKAKDKLFNKNPDQDKINHYISQIEILYHGIREILTECLVRHNTYKILLGNSNKLLILSDLTEKMELLKSQTNTLFLSESNPLIYDEVKSASNGAPIFEKANYYKHFFLDEFQDTSTMQWEDLKPIFINALGEGGSLTIFGDVKQSIYRFRNGNVNLLYNLLDINRLSQNEVELSNVIGDNYVTTPLDTNWRSLPNVVNFNNNFFEYYSSEVGKSEYYKEVKQKTVPTKNGGAVITYLYNKNKSAHLDISNITGDKLSRDYIANVYPELPINESFIIYSVFDALNRGYNYGDIMILLGSNDKCAEIAAKLIEADVPVVTSESLQLMDNPDIDLIINILQYYINPSDSLAQTTILKFFALKNQQNYAEILSNLDSFNNKMCNFGKPNFYDDINIIMKNPLFVAIKELIKYLNLDSTYASFLSDFLDIVDDYSKKYVANAEHFLIWWNDLINDNSIPKLYLSEGQNAVRIMTIHKSKGLEAPVVITICSEKNGNSSDLTWVKKDDVNCPVYFDTRFEYSDFCDQYVEDNDDSKLDKLNKWYVDFTRARDILYLVVDEKGTSNIAKLVTNYIKSKNTEGIIHQFDDVRYIYGNFEQEKVDKKSSNDKKARIKLEQNFSDFSLYSNKYKKSIRIQIKEDDSEDARVLGTQIHNVLQKLRAFPKTDKEIDEFVSKQSKVLENRLRSIFREVINDVESHPYYFVTEEDIVKNEADIILKDGTVCRPDRIVFKPDHVMIIDYKTGKADDKYEDQINRYKESLYDMGYTDVRTKIQYFN